MLPKPTPQERAALIQKVKTHCAPDALIEILSAEERWRDLLDCARRHADAPEFPRMIELLGNRMGMVRLAKGGP